MTVMNMLIGVLCEVVAQVAEEEKENLKVDKVKGVMERVMKNLDKDANQVLTFKEFEAILTDDHALQALKRVDVNPEGICDFAEMFFTDDNEQPVDLTFPDFM